jgi:hypothetical protein
MRQDGRVFTLLVLTENPLLDHDVQRLHELHADEAEVSAWICVPDGDHASAEEHLATSIALLKTVGWTVAGELVAHDPVMPVLQRAVAIDADEVAVVSDPHWVEDVLHRDWGSRIRHEIADEHRPIPVLHFISGTDTILS